MNTKIKTTKIDTDYFNFKNDEFYEWAAAAPTSDLVEAICGYFSVLEHDIKTIGEDTDFTDPEFLDDLNGIAWHFYDFGPWIMHIQDQLSRRYNLVEGPLRVPEAEA